MDLASLWAESQPKIISPVRKRKLETVRQTAAKRKYTRKSHRSICSRCKQPQRGHICPFKYAITGFDFVTKTVHVPVGRSI